MIKQKSISCIVLKALQVLSYVINLVVFMNCKIQLLLIFLINNLTSS